MIIPAPRRRAREAPNAAKAPVGAGQAVFGRCTIGSDGITAGRKTSGMGRATTVWAKTVWAKFAWVKVAWATLILASALTSATVASAQAPAAPPAVGQNAAPVYPAQAAPQPAPQTTDDPVGSVATLQGDASVTHNSADAKLNIRDTIYKGDVLQTSSNGTLG